MPDRTPPPGVRAMLAAALALSLAASHAAAQTDYYNTDAGRPVTVEDASPVEYRAVELQLAPLRLERARGGAYRWGIEPGIAVGVLPRAHVEVAFPLVVADGPHGAQPAGLAGIELSALHALNVETTIPALALAADLLLPVGPLAPGDPYVSVTGIATRTFPWARVHLNVGYTFGERERSFPQVAPPPGGEPAHDAHGELSRWTAGVAVDRAFPLRSLLVIAELVAREPFHEPDAALAWDAAAGARYQLSPRLALDGGAGYRLTGDRGWFATAGAAVAVGLPWRP